MAEFTEEAELEADVRTECELLEDQMSLLPSSDGLELLPEAKGGLGRRKSPRRARANASLRMSSTEAPSSSEELEV
jgi:hypothetical protein